MYKGELIDPHKAGERYVSSHHKGQFNKEADVSRSLATDALPKTKTEPTPGQDDLGDGHVQ